jgi:hypothetical protein
MQGAGHREMRGFPVETRPETRRSRGGAEKTAWSAGGKQREKCAQKKAAGNASRRRNAKA